MGSASRFDARTYAAQQAAKLGRISFPNCARCDSTAPLFKRPRPGCERTFPLANHQLDPALCGLCFDGIEKGKR